MERHDTLTSTSHGGKATSQNAAVPNVGSDIDQLSKTSNPFIRLSFHRFQITTFGYLGLELVMHDLVELLVYLGPGG